MTNPTIDEPKETTTLPDWAKGLWDQFQKSMRDGFLKPLSAKRHNPHQRMYTKAYADHRQRKGGGLYALVQSQIVPRAHPAPKLSAKARTRAIRREAGMRSAIRKALFGKRG